jgi:YcxB-like protein
MESQNEVTVDVTFEPGDFYWPFDWTWGNASRWTLAALAVLLGIHAWRFWPSRNSNFFLCVIAALALVFLWPWLSVRRHFRRYPAFRKPRRFTFDPEGMHFRSADASGDYQWSVFAKVVETPRRFLFMQTNRVGTTIPKRCLSQPDIKVLRNLVRENFQGKRRLRVD